MRRSILLRSLLPLAATLLTGCRGLAGTIAIEIERTPTPNVSPISTTTTRVEPSPVPTLLDPTQTPTPDPAAGLGSAPLPVAGGRCVNRAEFVRDLSVPDGTQFEPGELFVKTWRLRNSGSCIWNPSYSYYFAGGDRLRAYEVLPMPQHVAPGEIVDLPAAMTAPGEPGSYEGYWLLRDEYGAAFGVGPDSSSPFWVRVAVVIGTPSVRATPYADTPAAGICGAIEGELVTMTINPDVPDPRCVVVRPEQRLRVVNGREDSITVSLFTLSAQLDPGQQVTFDVTFGELLLPGVHLLDVSACCSGALWLQTQ